MKRPTAARPPHPPPNAGRCRRVGVAALASLALLFLAGAATAADPLPPIKPGLWHYHRTFAGKSVDITKCADPMREMVVMQREHLEKIGCTFPPTTRSGNVYTFSWACPGHAGSGFAGTSIITVKSNSAFDLKTDGTTNGREVVETLVARRIGACIKH